MTCPLKGGLKPELNKIKMYLGLEPPFRACPDSLNVVKAYREVNNRQRGVGGSIIKFDEFIGISHIFEEFQEIGS